MSKIQAAKKIAQELGDKALEVLNKVKTPEQAVALKGAERAEYLNALDIVHGPQAERAKDMGFGSTKQFYHGSPNSEIQKFDPSQAAGANTIGPGQLDGASYFTSSPEVAANYGQNIYPAKIARKGQPAIEPDWNTINPEVVQQMREIAPGKRNVTVNDVFDAIDSNAPKSDIVAVTDPSSVRSTNAAFDPRFKDSALILAGAGGVAAAPNVTQMLNAPIEKVGQFASDAQAKVSEIAGNVGSQISDLVRPPIKMDKAAIERERALAATAGEFGLDPTNILAPGAKAVAAAATFARAGKGIKVAEAVKKLLHGSVQSAKVEPAIQAAAEVAHMTKIKRAKYIDEMATALKTGEKEVEFVTKETSQKALQKTQVPAMLEAESKAASKKAKEAPSEFVAAQQKHAHQKLVAEATEHVKSRGLKGQEAVAALNQYYLARKSKYGL